METALALVVWHPHTGKGYRLISGPRAGIVFCADQDVATPLGTNVRVRFCPDDQYAKEIKS